MFQVGSSFRFLLCIDLILPAKIFPWDLSPVYSRIHSFHNYLLNIDKIHLYPFPFACGSLPRVETATQRMLAGH